MVQQDGGDFLVTPLEQRGKIAIVKGEGYVYFRWIDRSTNQMDVNCNWIVFQNSVIFKKIKTGRDEDRVYLLKWKDENRRLMFWMQEKSNEKDDENCKQVNELFNNPAAVAAAVQQQQQSSDVTGGGGGAGGRAEEWMRMLGLNPSTGRTGPTPSNSVPPSSTSTTNATSGTNTQQTLDLARILAGLGANSNTTAPSTSATSNNTTAPTTESSNNSTNGNAPVLSALDLQRAFASTSSAMGNSQQSIRPTSTDLSQVLNADAVLATGVFDDPAIRQNLLQLLPEGQQTDSYLETNLRSPQFQQALDALSSALSSESFNSVMANLGIDPTPGATELMRGNFTGAFLVAANAAAAARRQQQQQVGESSEGKEEKEDSKMDES